MTRSRTGRRAAMMGGDGMMHLGVNTCAPEHLLGGHPTALGLIPAGTGNDLCRGVGWIRPIQWPPPE